MDDFLNKALIRDKAPSKYLRQFAKENENLARTMRSHLIEVETFGVWNDDYETFLWKRCVSLSKALGTRIIKQAIDEQGQEVFTEDFEDTEDEAAE